MLHILFLLYNLFSSVLIIPAAPVLLIIILASDKYQKRIKRRLGWGLHQQLGTSGDSFGATIWMHALSVGETISSLPLVKELRARHPDVRIVFSVTSASGEQIAKQTLAPHVDTIIAAPLDAPFVINTYINQIRPDLFLLVETDFWPNWLIMLHYRNIPAILVNGRISQKSYNQYRKLKFLFTPLFSCFTCLCMQTAAEVEKMRSLGLCHKRVQTLGNLKLDTSLLIRNQNRQPVFTSSSSPFFLQENRLLWICGSTHPGEEEIIFSTYKSLKARHAPLHLLVAPRDISRSRALVGQAEQYGLSACIKTALVDNQVIDVCVLDTIGELAMMYQWAAVAFVGGSLVCKGGHNPLEAAVWGIPVLFGLHMEDFSEIAAALVASKGAVQIHDEKTLFQALDALLRDKKKRNSIGSAAQCWVKKHQGVVNRHMQLIDQLLPS
ncbi:MAG: hypothetical protein CSA32_00845 [Desulfobulbus propionicus]|nr:MAG: hypothetical protein CSA32_00845 [Desulfobulbus propionicus]